MNNNENSGASALQVLNKSELLGRQFTIYGTADNPLFLAKEVAEVIEHRDISTMVRMVDEEERLTQTLFVSGQNRSVWLLTEDGLYEVLMQSRKPIAKEFKKGVKSILKDIRTKGGYIVAQPEETPEQIMAKALRVADETLKRQQERLQEANRHLQMAEGTIEEQMKAISAMKPLADYTTEVLQSVSTFTLTQVAKDLGFTSVYKFTAWAKERGILYYQSRTVAS